MTREQTHTDRTAYDMVIEGKQVASSSGERFEVEFPYDRSVWATVPNATADDVDSAVESARERFESDSWRSQTATERGTLLYDLADVVEAHVDELARLETLGNGKPLSETRGQVNGFCARMRFYAGLADKVRGATIPVDDEGMFTFTRKEPYGVVGAVTPYNSPFSLAGFKLGPAVAAGNTIVFKPSEETPVSTIRMAELAIEAGWPPGVLNVVTGKGEAGAALTSHDDVSLVTFTGGVGTGQKVAETAGASLKPVKLELGGKSPNIVFPDADFERAVTDSIRGIFFSAGQTCIAGSRLFLHEDIHDEFLELLTERAEQLTFGDPFDEETDVGPVITESHRDSIQAYVDGAIEEGATLVTGGKPRDDLEGGLFYPPTILADVENDMTIACEEVFGPVLSVLTFENETEVLELANDTEFGLAAGVWTSNIDRAIRLSERLEAGNVWVNTYRQLSFTTPFGGYKKSGLGRENGTEAIEEYLQTKSVWMAREETPAQ